MPRLAPLYYLTNALSILISNINPYGIIADDCSWSPGILALLTLTMTNSWAFLPFQRFQPMPPNLPSWTITTLATFYLLLPLLLPRLQHLSDEALTKLTILLFYIQLWPLLLTQPNSALCVFVYS